MSEKLLVGPWPFVEIYLSNLTGHLIMEHCTKPSHLTAVCLHSHVDHINYSRFRLYRYSRFKTGHLLSLMSLRTMSLCYPATNTLFFSYPDFQHLGCYPDSDTTSTSGAAQWWCSPSPEFCHGTRDIQTIISPSHYHRRNTISVVLSDYPKVPEEL